MTKMEFIKRYGEEAYKKQLEISRKWREEHKEHKKEYLKKYRVENKEKIAAYRAEHKKEIEEKRKQYIAENKERISKRRHEYYVSHREEIREYNFLHRKEISAYNKSRRDTLKKYIAERRKTPVGRAESLLSAYNIRDKKRGFDTSLNVDKQWIIENIFNSQCVYCGESDWTKLGIDRIDNDKGHTPENSVCSCRKCNEERSDRYSIEEFVAIKKKEKGGA